MGQSAQLPMVRQTTAQAPARWQAEKVLCWRNPVELYREVAQATATTGAQVKEYLYPLANPPTFRSDEKDRRIADLEQALAETRPAALMANLLKARAELRDALEVLNSAGAGTFPTIANAARGVTNAFVARGKHIDGLRDENKVLQDELIQANGGWAASKELLKITQAKLEASERAAAAMREALEAEDRADEQGCTVGCRCFSQVGDEDPECVACDLGLKARGLRKQALSSDAGRDWVRREELEARVREYMDSNPRTVRGYTATDWMHKADQLRAERDALKEELEQAKQALKNHLEDSGVTCAYCGAYHPRPCTLEDLQAHVFECQKHPLAAVKAELSAARAECAAVKDAAQKLLDLEHSHVSPAVTERAWEDLAEAVKSPIGTSYRERVERLVEAAKRCLEFPVPEGDIEGELRDALKEWE